MRSADVFEIYFDGREGLGGWLSVERKIHNQKTVASPDGDGMQA
jgi:hypothetical protein